jgi:histidinol-phosphate aminotransferase
MKAFSEPWYNPQVGQMPVYEPGKPIETLAREHGMDPHTIVKLASNENPLGPSPLALEAARKSLSQVHLYPDGSGWKLREALARKHQLPPSSFLLGNGSNDVLEMLTAVCIRPGLNAVMSEDSFVVYRLATQHMGGEARLVPARDHHHDLEAMAAAVDEGTRIVFVASPNNPTGTAVEKGKLVEFARSLPPWVVFCLDQAYFEYEEDPLHPEALIREGAPVLVCRTFSKAYGLAGLRVGYGIGEPEWIAHLNRVRQPFNLNLPALAAAAAALEDQAFVERSLRMNRVGMDLLTGGLERLGIKHVPSQGNFVLAFFEDAAGIYERLLRMGVIVRPVGIYGLPNGLRISVGTPEEVGRFLETLTRVLR